ncbi:MAG: hypothetical protein KIT31_18580 [Deltaproteobacteria bacterium]|nr:hypothetical protein [Deltaproteobacteria bacterium]
MQPCKKIGRSEEARVTGAAPTFKYTTDYRRIGNCPPAGCAAMRATVFRWVYVPDPHDMSFVPPAKKNPARVWKDAADECCGMGLSMFTNAGGARGLYAVLRKRLKDRVKDVLGTHLASVPLAPNHGIADAPDQHGHFNFFEHAGADLMPLSRIIGPA